MSEISRSSNEGSFVSQLRSIFRDRLVLLSRSKKRGLLVFFDAVILCGAFWTAMMLRYGAIDFPRGERLYVLYLFLPVVGVFVFWMLGLYRSLLRSMEWQVLRTIVAGSFLTTLLIPFVAYIDLQMLVPRSVPFIYFMLIVIGIGSVRVILRELYRLLTANGRNATRVLVYGAGRMGTQLAALLQDAPEYSLAGFVDDDPGLQGMRIRGRKVFSLGEIMNRREARFFDEVFLAFYDPSQLKLRAAVQRLEGISVPIKTVPRVADMVGGNGPLDNLRDLRIEDLLGRQTVDPIEGLVEEGIRGKSILITGAAGSIGSELCRQVLDASPARLLAFDISEVGLYHLEQELSPIAQSMGIDLRVRLGSVLDRALLSRLIDDFGIEIMYHAAAYKHVPLIEDNVSVAVENNVFGTFSAASAAADAQIERFVFVSTDKAVRPTNVMGATKRLAELVVQSMQGQTRPTLFSMVRFGNVLGSSGSVVPLFSKQIDQGGPVTLTHKSVTRYFMTISEAAQLVLQAGFLARGGEVFLLDMGDPVRLEDLARLMIQLAGKRVAEGTHQEGAVEIREVGLRPGEKLFEELLIGDNAMGTRHPKIMQAQESKLSQRAVASMLKTLRKALDVEDTDTIVAQLSKHAEMTRQPVPAEQSA